MSEPVQAWTLRSIVEAISAEEMSFIPAALSAFRSDLGKTELADAFSGYKLQLDNRTHSSNKLSILERLREVYPNDRIVCVNAAELDLQGYVKAHTPQTSLAPVLDHDNPEQFDVYDGNCRYSAPERRLDESPGVIRDLFNFVQYRLVWQNQEHTVFFASWTPPAAGCVSYWFFVSSREMRSDSSANVPYTCTDTVAEILLRVGKWTSELHEEIYVFDDFRWKKSKSLFQSIQGATWDDVIMDAANKQGLIEDVQGFFKKETQQLYEQYSVAWKRGIILHGSPGNGKTISIKALVNALAEISVPALYVRTFANQRNMPQLSVAMIFEKARSMAPCLLILEDIDSLVEEKVRSYFLNELDGLESNDGILIIGSTNHLEKLDPAVAKRPSRFDRKYHFALPDREQRIAYAEYWRTKFSKKNDAAEFPLEACTIMADLTHGFSFAYCKELFVSTMLSLARVKGPNGDQVLASLASSAEQTVTAQSKPESEPGNAATADEKAPQPQENLVAVQATPMSAGLAQRMANFGASSAPRVSLALKAGTRDAEPRERNTVPASSLRPEDLHRIQTRLGEGLPEGLKDCVLLQVMLHHVAILIREMDTRAVE